MLSDVRFKEVYVAILMVDDCKPVLIFRSPVDGTLNLTLK